MEYQERSNDFVYEKFTEWFEEAKDRYKKKGIDNYNAFSLSTSVGGVASSRIVLLKDYSREGFIFYTNYMSRKAEEIEGNRNVAMLFYWPLLSRQIRVVGEAMKVDSRVSDEYFSSRSYLSKIGAWASLQSKPMGSYTDLVKRVIDYSSMYKMDVPRPSHWGGFMVVPKNIEFWEEKNARLHVRKNYILEGEGKWKEEILYP